MLASVQAFVFRWAAKKSEGLELSYSASFATVFVNLLGGFLLSLPIGIVLISLHALQGIERLVNLALIPAGCLLQAALISARHGLSFQQSLRVVFPMFRLGLAIAAACLVVFLVVGAAIGAALFSKTQ